MSLYRLYNYAGNVIGRVDIPSSPFPVMLRMHKDGKSVFFKLMRNWEAGSGKLHENGNAFVEWDGSIYGIDSKDILPDT